jgi:hypothetical protein
MQPWMLLAAGVPPCLVPRGPAVPRVGAHR